MTLPKTRKELLNLCKKLNCNVNEIKIKIYEERLRRALNERT